MISDIRQFFRFISVGLFNTLIDFTVFNILIIIFGLHHGYDFILYKSASFMIAVTNSYFWNRIWVFGLRNKNGGGNSSIAHFTLFAGISLVGLYLNTFISYVMFSVAEFLFPLVSVIALANLGAIIGSGVVWLFNFYGYKFIVFKNNNDGKSHE